MQIAAMVSGILWLGWRLWLSLTVPLGVIPEQAATALAAVSGVPEAADRLFIVNYGVQSAVFRVFGLSEITLRIFGIFLIPFLAAGVIRLAKKYISGESWGILVLMVCANPWITGLSLYHLPELLSLTAGIWMMASNKWGWKIGLGLVTAFSSPIGMAGVFLWGIYKLVAGKEKQAIVLLLVIPGMVFSNRQYLKEESQKLWLNHISPTRIAEEINEEQKINFLATQKTYILPSVLRKAIYNKPVFIVRKLVRKTFAVFDPTAWTAPQDAWVITSLSGFAPKGIIALFYYWEIPLIVAGILALKNRKWLLWFIPAIVLTIPAEEKFVGTAGLWLLPLLLGLIYLGAENLGRNYKRAAVVALIILYSLGYWNFGNRLFREQEGRMRSDTQIYLKMAGWIKENISEWEKIIVTERIGPTKLMMSFYGFKDNAKLEYRDFDLTRETPLMGSVYVGLPGEFTGPGENTNDRPVFNNRTILSKIEYGDQLVFNYGKGIWIGR